MADPIDLDSPIDCPACGGRLTETEHPPEEGETGTWWSYRCACGWEAHDCSERLTWRLSPGTRRLVDEVDKLRAWVALLRAHAGAAPVIRGVVYAPLSELQQAQVENARLMNMLVEAQRTGKVPRG